MSGPTPEHVDPKKFGGDPFQDDPRILPAFNGSSPSGDVTGDVVYANYGELADFKELAKLGVSVKDKIVLVRYGGNFRGVKVYIAQQYGAKGVLIYSDPADDGYFRGDSYPKGPWRPASGVQRGSVQFLPIYPGDPETPGIASTPDLPDSKRLPANKVQADQPVIPVNPLSYKDAAPILKALTGAESPRNWQGALPFTYHLGADTPASRVTVHMHLEQDTALRTIWDVIGTIDGTDPAQKEDWVVAGNHRDAWVYGAVDPNTGTAAMLETVHGLGDLLKQGWKPKRRIVIGSWDAEEEGLMGSTEWAEQHENHLAQAVAYFNTDVGVAGPNFSAAAVPSLKQFVREVTKEVPSPKGGTVYDEWKKTQETNAERRGSPTNSTHTSAHNGSDVHVGDLGSGSDYTPFLQHLGVSFHRHRLRRPLRRLSLRLRQLQLVHQIRRPHLRLRAAAGPRLRPRDPSHGRHRRPSLRLPALRQRDRRVSQGRTEASDGPEPHARLRRQQNAAERFAAARLRIHATRPQPPLLTQRSTKPPLCCRGRSPNPAGLPKRPWYKHTIYAPGEFTGYAAVVIPGVNEAIEAPDAARAQSQLAVLAEALDRSSAVLEAAAK